MKPILRITVLFILLEWTNTGVFAQVHVYKMMYSDPSVSIVDRVEEA
jgi:hypothetical protein